MYGVLLNTLASRITQVSNNEEVRQASV